MTAGICRQSGRADRLCNAANHATRCAVTECPTDTSTRQCLRSHDLVPGADCPCLRPCPGRNAEMML